MIKIINKIRRNKVFQNGFLGLMVFFVALIIAQPEIAFIQSMSDYLVHFTVLFFISGLFFLIINKRKAVLTSFGLCAVLCVFLKGESNSRMNAPAENNQQSLSIAHINLANAESAQELTDMMVASDPDVISVQELTPDWSGVLANLMAVQYPYSFTEVRIDPYGKGIYSKYPIQDVDSLNNNAIRDYKFELKIGQEIFCLYSSYLTPALDKNSKRAAQAQLLQLESNINKQQYRSLVFGEYNMTYWNEDIRGFRNRTNLLNTRKDVLPTSLKVPYDHIFFTPDIECLKFGKINTSSGNKLGLFANFQIKDEILSDSTIRAIQ